MSLPGLKMINFFQNLELCKMLIVLMQLVQLVISGFHVCFYIKWKAIRTKLKWFLKKWDSVWKLSFCYGPIIRVTSSNCLRRHVSSTICIGFVDVFSWDPNAGKEKLVFSFFFFDKKILFTYFKVSELEFPIKIRSPPI